MIGIFDSGIGGLSIYLEVKKQLPEAGVVYLADSANFPYGEKSEKELEEICRKNIKELIELGSKLIIIACNSATVSTINKLRTQFELPIVGIEPAVKVAAEKSKSAKIGLIATKMTVNRHQHDFEDNVIKEHQGELVEAIENDLSSVTDEMLKTSVEKLIKKGVSSIVLGCTHYHLVKERFEKLYPEIIFYAPDVAVASRVVAVTRENKISFEEGEDIFLVSGDLSSFKKVLTSLIDKKEFDVRSV